MNDDWSAIQPISGPFIWLWNKATYKSFFTKFANKYINNISKSNLKKLVIGFRVLLDEVYSASALFTGLGVGYRRGANPIIGKSNEDLSAIERLTGQEYQVLNTYWWSRIRQDRLVNDGFPDDGRVRNSMRDKHGNALVEFFESQERDSTN